MRLHGVDGLEVAAASELERLWDRGGYPQSYLADSFDASLNWREDYARSTLERSVSYMGLNFTADTLTSLLELLADQQGGIVNQSGLGRELKLSYVSVGTCLKYLQDLMLIRLLRPYSRSAKKRLRRRPKCYICDSGILHALRGCSIVGEGKTVPDGKLAGASWEGFVIENILAVLPLLWRASYYRDNHGNEIDLVLERPGGKPWAIEVKRGKASDLTPAGRRALHALQPERAFLVHGGTERRIIRGKTNVDAVPLADMMNELLAQQSGVFATPPPQRPANTMHDLAELLELIGTGIPRARRKRRLFIENRLAEMEAVVLAATGIEDQNAILIWSQVREELIKWLAEESDVNEDDPSANYVEGLRELLEGVLVLKHDFASFGFDQSQRDLAGWFAYDLFVSTIATLLGAKKFKLINYLLAGEYLGPQPSWTFGASLANPESDEAAQLQGFVLEASRQRTDRLIEADVIVMLFGLVESARKGVRSVQWWPLLYSKRSLRPDFMRWTKNRDGQGKMLSCVGISSEEYAQLGPRILDLIKASPLGELEKEQIVLDLSLEGCSSSPA